MQETYKIGAKEYTAYGMGNFASQLSWTMVSTYLSVFYTDVFGLAPAAVALLLLVAKVWDGINDPMMGAIMERTHTKWGRFRPYIAIGAPILVIFTILTFSVPNFGDKGNLIYAYITYIGLGMVYTMTNVPYQGLPAVMTRDPHKINRLNSAQTMGMMLGMILLNLITLPLVNYFEAIRPKAGYQITAGLYSIIALPMFWICAKMCKETVTVEKEYQPPLRESIKQIIKNKNLMMIILYTILAMTGTMGRIGVAVYFYLHVANAGAFTSIFMMMPMLIGAVIMPFAPKVMERFGKKKVIMFALVVQIIGLAMMSMGPYTSIPYLFLCHIIYGLGAIEKACGPCMIVDALDVMDEKTGVRPDGTAFSLMGLGTKIGTAIGSAIGVAIIGWYGYSGSEAVTAHVKTGINIGVNIMPIVIFVLAFIPVLLYSIKEEDMPEVRKNLQIRNEKRKAEQEKNTIN